MRVTRLRPVQTLTLLPFLVPFTSAISLNDIQPLDPSVTLQPCILAYKSPISDCQSSDFANSADCSQDCIAGLVQKGIDIKNNCNNIVAKPTDLIVPAFNGSLAFKLCKNVVSPTDSAGSGSAPSTIQQSLPSSSSLSMSTSTTINTAASTSSSGTLSTSTFSSPTTPLGSVPITSTQPRASDSHSSSSVSKSVIDVPGTTSLPNQTAVPASNGGGGSPFEFTGDANPQLSACRSLLGIIYINILLAFLCTSRSW